MPIPKRIYTCWLNYNPVLPEKVERCIESQKKCAKDFGYEHHIITLENFYKGSVFVNDAIRAQRWVKAADYLRMYYLYTQGGIFLDADMEIVEGKNFDKIIDECDRDGYTLFTAKEVEGFYANSSLGCEPGHRLLKEYLRRLDENFRGDGDLVFETGIRGFCDIFYMSDLEKERVKIYPTHYFYPYNHTNKEMNQTDDTIVIHWYMDSWKNFSETYAF